MDSLTPEDEQIMDYGIYKGTPFWVVLLDDDYCAWLYNRTALPQAARRFQNYLIQKKATCS